MNQFIIDDSPFSPQAVTVDATSVPVGDTVLFELARLGWRRIVQGGRVETFTVPAITNWKASVTPSDGISPVRLYLYNYPAFPDVSGAANNAVTLSGPVAIAGAALIGATVGNAAAASTYNLIAPSVGQQIELHALSFQGSDTATLVRTYAIVRSGAALLANAYALFIDSTAGALTVPSTSLSFPTPVLLPIGESLQVVQSGAATANSAFFSATYRYI
jgi:hypothetical protein